MPFRFHLAMDTLPSGYSIFPANEELPPLSDMTLLIRAPEGLEPSRTTCCSARVGSEEARCRAGLRPPPKLRVQFSRMQLSRRLKSSEMPRFLAPVGLIQSASLLGRERTGFSLKELFRPPSSLLIWFPFFFPTIFAGCLPRPTSVAGCPVTWLSPRFIGTIQPSDY